MSAKVSRQVNAEAGAVDQRSQLWPTIERPIVQLADVVILRLVAENAELRAQLAETQDQCIELAIDASELQAEIEALRQELAEARAGRRSEATLLDAGPDCSHVSVASTGAARPGEP